MSSGRFTTMSGMSSSCQEMTKRMTPQAARPGVARGRRTRRKAVKRVQPSILAASSSSDGSEAKYGVRMRTA
jgi:hypothetical protein